MSVWTAFAFVLVAAVALVVVIAVVGLRSTSGSDHHGIRRVRRVVTMARVLAAVLAVRVILDVDEVGRYGQGLALAPVVAATVWVIAGVAAELVSASVLRDGGANLEVRTLRRYLPTWGAGLLAGALLALLATGVLTSLLADASGRGLTYSCGPGCTSTRTPWPGPFYLLPVGVAFAVLLVLTAASLHLTVARPRGALGESVAAEDDRLRRGGVAVTLTVLALATAATAAGLMLFSILPVALGPDGPAWVRLALATVVVALLLAAAATGALLRSVLRVAAPAAPGGVTSGAAGGA